MLICRANEGKMERKSKHIKRKRGTLREKKDLKESIRGKRFLLLINTLGVRKKQNLIITNNNYPFIIS